MKSAPLRFGVCTGTQQLTNANSFLLDQCYRSVTSSSSLYLVLLPASSPAYTRCSIFFSPLRCYYACIQTKRHPRTKFAAQKQPSTLPECSLIIFVRNHTHFSCTSGSRICRSRLRILYLMKHGVSFLCHSWPVLTFHTSGPSSNPFALGMV